MDLLGGCSMSQPDIELSPVISDYEFLECSKV